MRKHFARLSVALLTFIVGVCAAQGWDEPLTLPDSAAVREARARG